MATGIHPPWGSERCLPPLTIDSRIGGTMPDDQLSPLFTWRSAICESDLPSTSRHVALVLSLHMSERGDSCFPSMRTLADETGYSRRTVQTHIQRLCDDGWLQQIGWKTWETPGGPQRTKRWKATVPRGRNNCTPFRKGGETDAEGGASGDERGRKSCTQGRYKGDKGRNGRTPAKDETVGPRIGIVPNTRS